MSKPIQVTQDMMETAMKEFQKSLLDMKLFSGHLSYSTDFHYSQKEEVRITYTREAWWKQKTLVDEFSSEVGWHGVIDRDPEDKNHFVVRDIIVFPQKVTGTTVDPDQKEYDQWLMELPDEQFTHCRFHGHSHVWMSTSPSSTDDTYQENMVKQLGSEDYYVFMIWNKRDEYHARVWDVKENTLYEDNEIKVEIEGDESLSGFLESAKKMVSNTPYSAGTSGNVKSFKGIGSSTPDSKKGEKQNKKEGKNYNAADYPSYYEDGYDDIYGSGGNGWPNYWGKGGK